MKIRTSWPLWPRKRGRPATTSPSPPVLANGVSSAATWQMFHPIRPSFSDHRARRDDRILVDDDDAFADRVALAVRVLHPVGVHQPAVVADAGVEVEDGVADHAVAADAEGDLRALGGRL